MRKLITLGLIVTLVLSFSIPVMAQPSYDSTVYVDITPDDMEIILAGDSVEVYYTVNVQNISQSGDLPQIIVTPFGDNTDALAASVVTKIANKKTAAFTFTVTYTEVGEYEFWVNIKNMQGNSGKWNYEFTTEKIITKVIAPPVEMPDGFTIDDGGNLNITKDALNIGNFSSNGKDITVTRNGVPVNVNSDINVNNNGLSIKAKAFIVGVYVITNTATGQTMSFEIANIDGNTATIIMID